MELEQVLQSLCCYDKKNPDNILENVDIEDISKSNYCYCDNCFYGRAKLALYILNLLENGYKR